MELEEAIKDIKVWLDFPVWFIHTGKDEDFLRRIDKSAIETILNHLTKREKMIELLIEDLQGEGCLNMTREEIGNYYERRIKLAEESE